MSEAWRQQEGEAAAGWLARLEGIARLRLDGWDLASMQVYLDAARRQVEQDRSAAERAEASAAETKAVREEAAETARQEKATASQARRAATEDLSHRARAAL